MAAPGYARPLANLTKRLRLSTPSPAVQCQSRSFHQRSPPPVQATLTTAPETSQIRHASTNTEAHPTSASAPVDAETAHQELQKIRLPRAVQATYLQPLRHKHSNAAPTCDLQMRSYSLRNLEVFADFAMRAAYYLQLSASGPVPLPRITERWTVPRSNFIFKKSQENFERITLRRMIQIRGGHPNTVAIWLAFLKKYQYYGIGMKANVYESGKLEVAEDMDAEAEKISERLGDSLKLVGGKRGLMRRKKDIESMLLTEPFKAQWGAYAAMSASQSVPNAGLRAEKQVVDGTEGAKSVI